MTDLVYKKQYNVQSTLKKDIFQGILNGPEDVAAPRDGNLIARDERKELDARQALFDKGSC